MDEVLQTHTIVTFPDNASAVIEAVPQHWSPLSTVKWLVLAIVANDDGEVIDHASNTLTVQPGTQSAPLLWMCDQDLQKGLLYYYHTPKSTHSN